MESAKSEIETQINGLKQRMNVTDERLDEECEDEDLDSFGRSIDGYMKYACRLGLSEAEISDIDGDIRIAHSNMLKLAFAFKRWKSKCKASNLPATYRSLLKVALKLEDGNAAEEICRACKESKPTTSYSIIQACTAKPLMLGLHTRHCSVMLIEPACIYSCV